MVHAITFFCKSHWTVTWPLVVKIPVCALTRCSVMMIWSSWSKNTVSRCPCQCSDVIGAVCISATDQDFRLCTLGILNCARCRFGYCWIISRRVTQFPSSISNCCQGNICLRSIGTVTYDKVGMCIIIWIVLILSFSALHIYYWLRNINYAKFSCKKTLVGIKCVMALQKVIFILLQLNNCTAYVVFFLVFCHVSVSAVLQW